MVTQTYRPGEDWSPLDQTGFIKRVREWARRAGFACRYTWVAELQQRGAVHYHSLLWLPRGVTMPKPDARGWWKKGLTRREWAKNSVGYIAKYASKVESKEGGSFPKGCRLYGCGGLAEAQRRVARWWKLPGWLRERSGSDVTWRPCPGGGWYAKETGEFCESGWRLSWASGGLVGVCKVPRRGADLPDDGQGRLAWREWVYEEGRKLVSDLMMRRVGPWEASGN